MKKFTFIAIILVSFVFSSLANSPADTEAVKKASLNYIEGFYEGDDSKLRAGISPDLNKHGFWKSRKTGKYKPAGDFPFSKALAYAKDVREKKRFAKPNAKKKVEVLGISSKIAITKIIVNWGVDYMLLAKNDGKWMIRQVLWEGPNPTATPTAIDKQAVKDAGMDYIEGFYEGDESKLKNALKPTMFKYGYSFDKETDEYKKGKQMTFEKAIAVTKWIKEKNKYPKADAPKKVEVLDVMNHIAAIKVTSYWGTDYILVSRTDDKWMIDQILWAGYPQKKS